MLIDTLFSQDQRTQLYYLKTYLFTCKQSIADEFRQTLWPREYFYEDIHSYALSVSIMLRWHSTSWMTLCKYMTLLVVLILHYFCGGHIVPTKLIFSTNYFSELPKLIPANMNQWKLATAKIYVFTVLAIYIPENKVLGIL